MLTLPLDVDSIGSWIVLLLNPDNTNFPMPLTIRLNQKICSIKRHVRKRAWKWIIGRM